MPLSFTFNADGSFEYTPNVGFIGTDTFTYRASDSTDDSLDTTVSIVVNSIDKQIVINEIYYDPPENEIHSEFIELYNAGSQPVVLSGWEFTDGVSYVFPANTEINSGEYLLIAANPAVVLAEFGKIALGPWQGGLSNNGEKIELRNSTGDLIDEVDYNAEFPWPIAANGDGASMELIHPSLDNDLAGSWRSSLADNDSGGDPPEQQVTYLSFGQTDWAYRKGTSEASNPTDAWRQAGFVEDGTWFQNAETPIGYNDGDDATILTDMQGNYSTIYLRNEFVVPVGEIPDQLLLSVIDDDGAIVWINGIEVERFNVTDGFKAFNATAINHEAALEQFLIEDPSIYLVEGVNTIAVHALNQNITSTDLTIDVQLQTPPPGPQEENLYEPTPGEENSVFALNAPPQTRQVKLDDQTPTTGDDVTLTAKVTDPNGVASVVAKYQVNLPGQYIPAFLPLDNATLQKRARHPAHPEPCF